MNKKNMVFIITFIFIILSIMLSVEVKATNTECIYNVSFIDKANKKTILKKEESMYLSLSSPSGYKWNNAQNFNIRNWNGGHSYNFNKGDTHKDEYACGYISFDINDSDSSLYFDYCIDLKTGEIHWNKTLQNREKIKCTDLSENVNYLYDNFYYDVQLIKTSGKMECVLNLYIYLDKITEEAKNGYNSYYILPKEYIEYMGLKNNTFQISRNFYYQSRGYGTSIILNEGCFYEKAIHGADYTFATIDNLELFNDSGKYVFHFQEDKSGMVRRYDKYTLFKVDGKLYFIYLNEPKDVTSEEYTVEGIYSPIFNEKGEWIDIGEKIEINVAKPNTQYESDVKTEENEFYKNAYGAYYIMPEDYIESLGLKNNTFQISRNFYYKNNSGTSILLNEYCLYEKAIHGEDYTFATIDNLELFNVSGEYVFRFKNNDDEAYDIHTLIKVDDKLYFIKLNAPKDSKSNEYTVGGIYSPIFNEKGEWVDIGEKIEITSSKQEPEKESQTTINIQYKVGKYQEGESRSNLGFIGTVNAHEVIKDAEIYFIPYILTANEAKLEPYTLINITGGEKVNEYWSKIQGEGSLQINAEAAEITEPIYILLEDRETHDLVAVKFVKNGTTYVYDRVIKVEYDFQNNVNKLVEGILENVKPSSSGIMFLKNKSSELKVTQNIFNGLSNKILYISPYMQIADEEGKIRGTSDILISLEGSTEATEVDFRGFMKKDKKGGWDFKISGISKMDTNKTYYMLCAYGAPTQFYLAKIEYKENSWQITSINHIKEWGADYSVIGDEIVAFDEKGKPTIQEAENKIFTFEVEKEAGKKYVPYVYYVDENGYLNAIGDEKNEKYTNVLEENGDTKIDNEGFIKIKNNLAKIKVTIEKDIDKTELYLLFNTNGVFSLIKFNKDGEKLQDQIKAEWGRKRI